MFEDYTKIGSLLKSFYIRLTSKYLTPFPKQLIKRRKVLCRPVTPFRTFIMFILFVLLSFGSSIASADNQEFLKLTNESVENIPVCNSEETAFCVRVWVNFTLLRSSPEELLFPEGKVLYILGPDEIDEETEGITYSVSTDTGACFL